MNEHQLLQILQDFTLRRMKMYLFIKKNIYCNITQIAKEFKISYKEAHRDIEILFNKGYVGKSREKLKHAPCKLVIQKKLNMENNNNG